MTDFATSDFLNGLSKSPRIPVFLSAREPLAFGPMSAPRVVPDRRRFFFLRCLLPPFSTKRLFNVLDVLEAVNPAMLLHNPSFSLLFTPPSDSNELFPALSFVPLSFFPI